MMVTRFDCRKYKISEMLFQIVSLVSIVLCDLFD